MKIECSICDKPVGVFYVKWIGGVLRSICLTCWPDVKQEKDHGH